MSTLQDARRARARAVDQLENLAGDAAAFAEKQAEIDQLTGKIERLERAQAQTAALARPMGDRAPGSPLGASDPTKFVSLGEQLLSVARHYSGGTTDGRLVRAPAGMGENDPSAGGFMIQTEFANTILQRLYELGEIAKRVFRLQIGAQYNGTKIPGIDETSRATGSRWGGVQAYWVGEGDQATATKPKFRLIELDLKKLMATWYVTDEMLQDAAVLTGIANEAFAQELLFMTEDAVIHGTGAGQPLGILNAKCTVQVSKEKGQANQTILYQNLLNMWQSMWARSRQEAAWFINQEIEPQLYSVNQVIGTAGAPVYLPPGGISGAPYSTLFGRPVVPVEYCEGLGTPGDIILADFSQYVMADKNAMQQASSMHVRFLTDEMTFRLTYRVDGEPVWQAPLTPFKTALNTVRSPFITLAQR